LVYLFRVPYLFISRSLTSKENKMQYQQPTNFKELYNSIKILPLVLIGGLCMISGILIFLKQGDEMTEGYSEYFVILIALVAAAGFVFGSFIFRKRIADSMGKTMIEKLVIYRQAMIVRFALLEGPGLISTILFFLTGNYLYMVITGAMVLFMIMNRPNDDMIATHLMLTEEDKQLMIKLQKAS
jgi:hypothetical protein